MSVVNDEVSRVTGKRPVEEWRIGFILIRSKRLRKEEVVRIVELQRQRGILFGDAAIQLGLLNEDDVRFALAQQFDFPFVSRSESNISKDIVAAYEPQSASGEAIRGLRSQLMTHWYDSGHLGRKALAIVGIDRGVGRSWIAANLAVAFSQLGKNTVLIDGDLRNPTQHHLFGLDNQQGLSEILCGRGSATAAVKRNEVLPKLAVITSGTKPPNPQEVIARDEFAELLEQLQSMADVILIDSPADSQGSDGQLLAKRAGGAVLVAKRRQTRVASLNNYVSTITATGASLVLNVLVD
jgi:protein-tyrosine kinase